MRRAAACAALLLAGCATSQAANDLAIIARPPGVNLVLEGPVAAAPGHHLVMGDIVMPPGGAIPRHIHSGEEFLYIIGGSAILTREGEPDLVLSAGQGVRIAPGVVHGGTGGPEGARAVSTWIVRNGEPLRTSVP